MAWGPVKLELNVDTLTLHCLLTTSLNRPGVILNRSELFLGVSG